MSNEAVKRGYNFDRSKINWKFKPQQIIVTSGQVKYETEHLPRKLKVRDPEKFKLLKDRKKFQVHPLFTIVKGQIEDWEVVG